MQTFINMPQKQSHCLSLWIHEAPDSDTLHECFIRSKGADILAAEFCLPHFCLVLGHKTLPALSASLKSDSAAGLPRVYNPFLQGKRHLSFSSQYIYCTLSIILLSKEEVFLANHLLVRKIFSVNVEG